MKSLVKRMSGLVPHSGNNHEWRDKLDWGSPDLMKRYAEMTENAKETDAQAQAPLGPHKFAIRIGFRKLKR